MELTDGLAIVFHQRYADAVLQLPFRARIDIPYLELQAITDQGHKFVNEQFAQVTAGPCVMTVDNSATAYIGKNAKVNTRRWC